MLILPRVMVCVITRHHVENDQDTRLISVHKNGSLIETFVSKNSNIHPSQPQVTQLN